MKTAKEIQEIATSAHAEREAKEIKTIELSIELVAKTGGFKYHFSFEDPFRLSSAAINRFRALGFIVDIGGYPNGTNYTISWKP